MSTKGQGRAVPLNALRAFEAVARHGSFSRAAEELCVTQGAVSRQVANLERHLEAVLFRRVNRQVQLTPKGTQLFPVVSDAFQRIREGMHLVTGDALERTLKVKVPPTFGIRWLVPRLARFHGDHPEIDVQITTSHQTVDFDREDIDVAVYWGFGEWKDLAAEFLLGEDLVPVCSPELLKGKRLRHPRDLADFVLLRSMHRTDDWRIWMKGAGVSDVDWIHTLSFENSALTYQAAVDRLGVVVAQYAFVADDIAAKRLTTPFPRKVPGERAYFLVYPQRHAARSKVVAFRTWLMGEATVSIPALLSDPP